MADKTKEKSMKRDEGKKQIRLKFLVKIKEKKEDWNKIFKIWKVTIFDDTQK